MLDAEECSDGMYVYFTTTSDTSTDELPINLEDLELISGDDETKQAVKDWRYWCARGYRLANFDEYSEFSEEHTW